MAQSGYTPIQLYYSTTAAAVPVNTNLANGELAINITDGKLFYKNNSGVVTLLAGGSGAITPLTNNGVVYVNGSGQATSGSALTFSGNTLTNNAGIFKANGAPSLVAATAGEAILAPEGTLGALVYGRGTTYDVTLGQRSTAVALGVLAGTVNLYAPGRVGIDTTTPTSLLSVGTLGTSSNPAIQIGSATNSSGSLYFGDGTGADTYRGYVEYNHSTDSMLFGAAAVELMRLTSTGLGIGTSSPVDSLTVYKSTSAGTSTVTFINTATANTANTMRIRLAPSPGFVGTNLQPYIESYCEDAGSQAAGLAFGTYPTGAATERLRITSAGNILVGGTAARGTTVGTAHLDLFNGTAPAGGLTNGVSLYSSSGDLKFMNAAGDAFDVGYRNIPQNAQGSNYTLTLADAGKHIYRSSGSAATWTIPANSSVAYPVGTAITFINLSATAVSIAITTDTMYLSSAGTTGTRTLAQYGSATAIKFDPNNWIISGSGLT